MSPHWPLRITRRESWRLPKSADGSFCVAKLTFNPRRLNADVSAEEDYRGCTDFMDQGAVSE